MLISWNVKQTYEDRLKRPYRWVNVQVQKNNPRRHKNAKSKSNSKSGSGSSRSSGYGESISCVQVCQEWRPTKDGDESVGEVDKELYARTIKDALLAALCEGGGETVREKQRWVIEDGSIVAESPFG